ncbi:MAG: polymer-forming cytoskeletal protein, partial [Bryobacterales bacterium]|nr:polymer-forming cytoskeletal protein [Bryobacterales bacterium]
MWGRKEDQSYGEETPSAAPQQPALQPNENRIQPAVSQERVISEKSIASRLGHSVKFSGEIHAEEDFLLDGDVEGTIRVPKHTVIVGSKGNVRATIEANTILIHGQVRGHLNVKQRLIIAKTGRFEGELITQRLEIQDGAVLIGTSALHKPEQPSGQGSRPPAADKKAEPASPRNMAK